MSSFEILCVTMHQNDFSNIQEMNVHSNIVFANQCDHTSYDEIEFDGNYAKMISTETRGVGINRNLSLMYASADICLLADDDVVYNDNYREVILKEFSEHPDADVFVFHFETDSSRKQIKYSKTKKCGKLTKRPWGAIRIAFKLNSIKKANISFTTLFGGGCIFPSGEDSMWIIDAVKKGLCIYVSKETIGKVKFEKSSWFTGYNEKFYYGKGAFYAATHPFSFGIWALYFSIRSKKLASMNFKNRLKWIFNGKNGYKKMLSYEDYIESQQ